MFYNKLFLFLSKEKDFLFYFSKRPIRNMKWWFIF